MTDTNYIKYKERELKKVKAKIAVLEGWINTCSVANPKFLDKWKELNGLRWKVRAIKDRLSNKANKKLGMEEYRIPDVVRNNY